MLTRYATFGLFEYKKKAGFSNGRFGLKRLKFQIFATLRKFSVPFHEGVNVIIGHNNTSKSNLLRAVGLVLGYSDGRRLGTSDLFYETDVVMGVCLSRMRGIGCNQQRMGIFRQPSFP